MTPDDLTGFDDKIFDNNLFNLKKQTILEDYHEEPIKKKPLKKSNSNIL